MSFRQVFRMRTGGLGRALTSPVNGVRNFCRDRRGVAAVFVAAAIIPIIAAIGIAADTTLAYLLKSRVSAAVDAAALAGGRAYFKPDAERDQDVLDFFYANYPDGYLGAAIVVPDIQFIDDDPEFDDNDTVRVKVRATMPTKFMRVVGIDDVSVTSEATVTRENSLLDVVLALDVSGSMRDNIDGNSTSVVNDRRISLAKDAAKELVNILFGSNATSNFLRIGVVPWGGKVNITDFGTTYGIDPVSGGAQPPPLFTPDPLGATVDHPFREEHYYFEYDADNPPSRVANPFSSPISPDDSDDRRRYVLKNWTSTIDEVYIAHNSKVPLLSPPTAGWTGCVYARYARTSTNLDDVDDLLLAADDKLAAYDTLAIPPGELAWVGWMPMGSEGEPVSGSADCDMANLNPSHGDDCTPCPSAGITRLTSTKADLITLFENSSAPTNIKAESSVYTNIPQGLVWAWRALMPDKPFTEAAAVVPNTSNFRKRRAIILLTDGANTRRNGDAYNRALDGTSKRDNRLRLIADRIKCKGSFAGDPACEPVDLYTIQFAESSGSLETLMKDVASDPDAVFYYKAPTADELRTAFQEIANNLANLHLSR